MNKLSKADLYTLEAYARERPAFRARVLDHKQPRKVSIGAHVTLLFEDRLTIQYQVQEMLRVERIFEAAGIQDELDSYNPLIPDGGNLKATMLIEYQDPDERKRALSRLKGIEDRVWIAVAGHARVHAIADEDLERETDDKTSSVHFLRFEFAPAMIAALKRGAALSIGVDHPALTATVDAVPEATRASLLQDFD